MQKLPNKVKIIEVGARDGLQNEPGLILLEDKLKFISMLSASGLRDIEAAAFVHPKYVPQMADSADLIPQLLAKNNTVNFSALVPNMKGLEKAIESGIKRIAVFSAASETFTAKNINMSIAESLKVFKEVIDEALKNKISVRAYLSTCFVCPYEGEIDHNKVYDLSLALLDMGVDEVSLGDTIGAAAPTDVHRLLETFQAKSLDLKQIALHMHDTYGTALANVAAGLEHGISTFDSSCGGLGGCPYAPGASGNLATEDLVYMLDRMGIETGVSLEALVKASTFIEQKLNKTLPAKNLRRLSA